MAGPTTPVTGAEIIDDADLAGCDADLARGRRDLLDTGSETDFHLILSGTPAVRTPTACGTSADQAAAHSWCRWNTGRCWTRLGNDQSVREIGELVALARRITKLQGSICRAGRSAATTVSRP